MADRPTPRQSETFEAYEVRRIAAALRRARLEADHTQNALCAGPARERVDDSHVGIGKKTA